MNERPRGWAAVEGYDERSYGRGMADVYDEWYPGISDVDGTVASIAELAGPGARVLELGVGTGRLALPLSQRGLDVHGVDTSPEMLDRLRAKSGADAVTVVEGDMAAADPPGPFALAFVAYNTLFNLTSAAAQRACFASVAARLTPGGRFVVEAFVPDERASGSYVEVRELTADRVVLGVSRADHANQRAEGQFVELVDGAPVRLRPWAIRWATPGELDDMAASAGLTLEYRWSGWRGEPFDADSPHHVSVWKLTQH